MTMAPFSASCLNLARSDDEDLPGGLGRLTPKEREVAMAVARALTNRQVARLLSMSPRTVESHLSRIYAKLDIRSRFHLCLLLGPREQSTDDAAILASLSPREAQVVSLVGTGLSNRQAARLLFVSPKTVEFHLARAFTKLRVSSREQLATIVGSLAAEP